MLKRICAWILCLLLLVAALPVTAFAATTEEEEAEEQRICDQIADFYQKIVRATGIYNLEGWCGLMAGWELYFLGVTSVPLTYNGNDQYDGYLDMDVTDTGHHIQRYPAVSYTIEEALNTMTRCGTMNVYNLMAGFHKTRTAAGQLWGHVTVIHAVLGGNVYYTEGFDTDYGLKPSLAQICSIEEWADLYESWTTFEGLVDFGTKAYADFCTYYPAHLFVVSDQAVTLLTDPGSPEAAPLRTTLPGERLYAIGLYENLDGKLFYQIRDDGQVCYLPAAEVKPYYFDFSDVTIGEFTAPEALEIGSDFALAGNLYSTNNRLYNICIQVLDTEGTPQLQYDYAKDSCFFDLGHKQVNNRVNFSKLPEGHYTYQVTAEVANHYVAEDQIMEERRNIRLIDQAFTVGAPAEAAPKDTEVFSSDPLQGWQYQQGRWFFYADGQAHTGWLYQGGLDYYMTEDGSAATGWQEINGKNRYFSSTGVLRTGWLDTGNGRMYLLRNGVAAIGWRTIEDQLYCFGKDGILLTDCTAEKNGTAYTIGSDGIAVPTA